MKFLTYKWIVFIGLFVDLCKPNSSFEIFNRWEHLPFCHVISNVKHCNASYLPMYSTSKAIWIVWCRKMLLSKAMQPMQTPLNLWNYEVEDESTQVKACLPHTVVHKSWNSPPEKTEQKGHTHSFVFFFLLQAVLLQSFSICLWHWQWYTCKPSWHSDALTFSLQEHRARHVQKCFSEAWIHTRMESQTHAMSELRAICQIVEGAAYSLNQYIL